jgi:N-acetylmuramate 1-kinase
MLVGENGSELAIIDFQDALMGTPQYDVVALLRDSYSRLADAELDELIAHYLSERRATGLPAIDPVEFRRVFDLQTVQRKLKDAGRFVFIDRVKGNPSFLQHIPTSVGYARDALRRQPDLAKLHQQLGRFMPELL